MLGKEEDLDRCRVRKGRHSTKTETGDVKKAERTESRPESYCQMKRKSATATTPASTTHKQRGQFLTAQKRHNENQEQDGGPQSMQMQMEYGGVWWRRSLQSEKARET
eukprot:c25538_g1_i4 orf=789-1112(+)